MKKACRIMIKLAPNISKMALHMIIEKFIALLHSIIITLQNYCDKEIQKD
jgi:hypothetical protein